MHCKLSQFPITMVTLFPCKPIIIIISYYYKILFIIHLFMHLLYIYQKHIIL